MAELLVWIFMIVVCTVVAMFSAMLGFMANMDRGGIHPFYAGISGVFVLADLYLLFYSHVHVVFN